MANLGVQWVLPGAFECQGPEEDAPCERHFLSRKKNTATMDKTRPPAAAAVMRLDTLSANLLVYHGSSAVDIRLHLVS